MADTTIVPVLSGEIASGENWLAAVVGASPDQTLPSRVPSVSLCTDGAVTIEGKKIQLI